MDEQTINTLRGDVKLLQEIIEKHEKEIAELKHDIKYIFNKHGK